MTVSVKRAQQIKNRELYGGDPDLISAANPNVVHGKYSTYTNWACRCDPCKKAWSNYVQAAKARRGVRPVPEGLHGTQNAYGNYGCRCEACTEAWRIATLDRAHRRRQRALDAKRETTE